MEKYSIVLFDGECNLCDRLVTFVIDRDPKKKFKFASIQSEIGKQLIQTCGGNPDKVTAMYLIDPDSSKPPQGGCRHFAMGEGRTTIGVEGKKCYQASTAALRIAKELSGPWSILYGFIIIPPFLRNIVYFVISKTRTIFFGTVNTCRIMTPELEERFLSRTKANLSAE